MKRFAVLAWSLAVLGMMGNLPLVRAADEEKPKATEAEEAAPLIQLAVLLDTSGSMSGLINQARTQLWKIVNELATAKQNGKLPQLQVALYEYGKSSLAKDEGYLRQIVAFTDNLDQVSQELFALETNGGEEYCGQVISAATAGLAWSSSDSTLKLIFIAGNEPFTQGTVDYREACKAAVEKGITVNTIFCGPEAQGIQTGWRDGAMLADGSFMSINQDQQVATVVTPFDKPLAELGAKINTTYFFVGDAKKREANRARQLAADQAAAASAPAAAAERAAFKGKAQYSAGDDLVTGVQSGKIKLEELKEDALPDPLQNKSLEEKQAIVKNLSAERAEIQQQINKLSQQRAAYIAAERKKQAAAGEENTLDVAILRAVREQAVRKEFKFAE